MLRGPSDPPPTGSLQRILAWEQQCTLNLNRAVSAASWRRFLVTVSRLGDGGFWYVLIITIAISGGSGSMRAALHMIVAGLVGTASYKLLKRRTGRPRPCTRFNGLNMHVQPLDEFSFPSGHTLHAVTFTTVAIHYYPMLGWALVPFTALTAVSRVALGLHYPTDVLAGAIFGAFIAGAALLW